MSEGAETLEMPCFLAYPCPARGHFGDRDVKTRERAIKKIKIRYFGKEFRCFLKSIRALRKMSGIVKVDVRLAL